MAGAPYHDRDGWIWFDGEWKPWREANLHVLSHGLHYASSVFEGERAYGGEIFKLEEHTERLYESARWLDFEIPFSPATLNEASREAVRRNGLVDCYIRPIAWRGSGQMGVAAQNAGVHVAIAAWDWGSYFDPAQRLRGIRLRHADYRRPDPATIPCKAKAAGLYMICTLEKHKAEARGYADALMLDYRGNVAECTGANIFFIKDGTIHTPRPDAFLDGITRRTVIDLARRRGYTLEERIISPTELASFSECFITGTAAEITPVSEIGDFHYKPGAITETLLNDYMAVVRPKAAVAE
ncbi:MAG: branched-chain amino acid aminotransferase [Rhizobiales bacterium]|nr:branched-chain amino acid aminotransferase [Hyphomicrobiales bacterium]